MLFKMKAFVPASLFSELPEGITSGSVWHEWAILSPQFDHLWLKCQVLVAVQLEHIIIINCRVALLVLLSSMALSFSSTAAIYSLTCISMQLVRQTAKLAALCGSRTREVRWSESSKISQSFATTSLFHLWIYRRTNIEQLTSAPSLHPRRDILCLSGALRRSNTLHLLEYIR